MTSVFMGGATLSKLKLEVVRKKNLVKEDMPGSMLAMPISKRPTSFNALGPRAHTMTVICRSRAAK